MLFIFPKKNKISGISRLMLSFWKKRKKSLTLAARICSIAFGFEETGSHFFSKRAYRYSVADFRQGIFIIPRKN